MRILIPLATGFEEIEAVTVIDVLRRAGAEVVVAGLTEGPVTASRGVKVMPDTTLDRVASESFDAIVLPGGGDGARNLAADPRVGELLDRANKSNRLIGAICAAPAVVLQPQGLLDGKRATCHPSLAAKLPSRVDERVVTDGRIITSQGPGTSLEFALALVEHLLGPEKAAQVRGPLIMK